MKNIIKLILAYFVVVISVFPGNVLGEDNPTVDGYLSVSDSVGIGTLVEFKLIQGFSNDGPVISDPVKVLYWGRIEIFEYLKHPGYSPKNVHVFWFEYPDTKTTKHPKNLLSVAKKKMIWFFDQTTSAVEEGVFYPDVIYLSLKELKEVKWALEKMGKRKKVPNQ